MSDPERETDQQAEHPEVGPGVDGVGEAAGDDGGGRADPVPGAAWVADHEPPASEAERQALETVRSVSRLEESN